MNERVNLLDAMRARGFVGAPAHAFQPPVRVKMTKIGLTTEIRDVQAAGEQMLTWPEDRRGPRFRKAAKVFIEVLEGTRTPAVARAAFEAAAREAGMLLEW